MDFNLYAPGGRFRENRFHPESEDFFSLSRWNAVPHPVVCDFRLLPGSPARGTGLGGEDMGAYPRADGTVIGPAGGLIPSDLDGRCFADED